MLPEDWRHPTSLVRRIIPLALAACCALQLAGCADTTARKQLDDGNAALNAKQYDRAADDANAYLRQHPTGADAAEAYYLIGRIYEQRALDSSASPTVAVKRQNLDAAKGAYMDGVAQRGTRPVQALLHSGVANVSYFEDDFATALAEWQIAYDNFQNDDAKAWTLLRIGMCQQHLGRFTDADQTFQQVMQNFAGSEPARRAAADYGIHQFYVQVARFTDPAQSQHAVADLRSHGFTASQTQHSGTHIVQVGPVPTFAQARDLQRRLRGQYPGSVIEP